MNYTDTLLENTGANQDKNYLFLIGTDDQSTIELTQIANPGWQILPIHFGRQPWLETWLTKVIPETGTYRIVLSNKALAENRSRTLLTAQRIATAIDLWQRNAKLARERHLQWLKNSLTALAHGLFFKPELHANRILILAAGPSLNDFIDSGEFFNYTDAHIVALPPAVAVLAHYRLKPDAVFTADSGYWAGRHLAHSHLLTYQLLRGKLPSQFDGYRIPVAVSPLERLLWNIFYYPSLPQSGDGPTVATIALQYFRKLCPTTPIILAGMDLAIRNDQFHALPHTYDTGGQITSSKINPFTAENYARTDKAELQPLGNGWQTTRELRLFRLNMDLKLPNVFQIGPKETLIYPVYRNQGASGEYRAVGLHAAYQKRHRNERHSRFTKLWPALQRELYGISDLSVAYDLIKSTIDTF